MNQTNVFVYIVQQIVNAFLQMASFQVLPGVSVLFLSIFLLTVHTIFDLFWFSLGSVYGSELRSEINYSRSERQKEARKQSREWRKNNKT